MTNMTSQIGPQPAQVDFEETLASLESLPLFMKTLPSEGSEDIALQALQSLVYDGTPDGTARNFKEQGNDYFKGKRYREAAGFYTQGLDAKPTDSTLREALYCNRAACNLELGNYGSVLMDCTNALNINAQSSKALYRSAAALLALDRPEEALDCCDRCLKFDPHNRAVESLRSRAESAKNAKDRGCRQKKERLRKEKEEERLLQLAFKASNFSLYTSPGAQHSIPNGQERHLYRTNSPHGTTDNPYSPHFDPDDPARTRLVFPVFFLYPQYATSDVIARFVEDTTFCAHISQMFPPQVPPPTWDEERQYIASNIVVYATTRRKRLLKVGKKMTLRDVCEAAKEKEGDALDGLEIKDGYLTFVVLPKGGKEQEWVEGFKRTRDMYH